MSSKQANRILYRILMVVVPLGIAFILVTFYGVIWFLVYVFVHHLLYRPFINIARLHSLNVIDEKEFWRFFIPYHSSKYFRMLWFG